jgi:hypothetical protein
MNKKVESRFMEYPSWPDKIFEVEIKAKDLPA